MDLDLARKQNQRSRMEPGTADREVINRNGISRALYHDISFVSGCVYILTLYRKSIPYVHGANAPLIILFTYYIWYELRAWVRAVLVRVESVGKYELRAWVMYE